MTLARVPTLSLAAALVLAGCGAPAAPTINSFMASEPTLPAAGGKVTLSWDVAGATELIIDNGLGAAKPATKGSLSVSVTATTTFTLTAANAAGIRTSSVTVIVLDYAAAFVGTWKGNANAPAGPMYSYLYTFGNYPSIVTVWPELVPATQSNCNPPDANPETTITVTEVSTNVIRIVGMFRASLPLATVTAAGAALPAFSSDVSLWEVIKTLPIGPTSICSIEWGVFGASFSDSVVSISRFGELELNITGTFTDPYTQGIYTLTYSFSGTKS
jgi:hypothetical protein